MMARAASRPAAFPAAAMCRLPPATMMCRWCHTEVKDGKERRSRTFQAGLLQQHASSSSSSSRRWLAEQRAGWKEDSDRMHAAVTGCRLHLKAHAAET